MVLRVLRSKKVAKKVLTAMLMLIIPAFILWGVKSSFNKAKVLGVISGQKITTEDLLNSMDALKVELLLAYSDNYTMANRLLKNKAFMNSKSWERLIMLINARKSRIKVTDKEVMAFIMRSPVFRRGGVFDISTYQYIVRNNFSLTTHEFEELIRQNLMVEHFRQKITAGITVSDKEALDYLKSINDKYDFSYIQMATDTFAGQADIKEQDVEKYYSENREKFYEPRKIEIEYLEVPGKNTGEPGPEVEKIYSDARKTPDKFREIASASGLTYKNPKPFSENDIIPGISFSKDLQKKIFDLGVGDIMAPALSAPGNGKFLIIRKVKDIPPAPKDINTVKGEIVLTLKHEKSVALAEESINKLYAAIKNGATSFEKAAASAGLTVKKTGPLKMNGYIEDIGPAKPLISEALGSMKNTVLKPIETRNGFLLARIDAIVPVSMKAFEEHKANIKKFLRYQKELDAVKKWVGAHSKDIKLYVSLDNI